MTPPSNNSLSSSNFLTKYVSILVFLGFYYTSYRYPLQINSSGTSPGYSDTPAALQLGKYLIFAVICFVHLLKIAKLSRYSSITRTSVLISTLAIYLAVTPFFYVSNYEDISNAINGVFWLIVPFILLSGNNFGENSVSPRKIKKLLEYFFYLSIAFFIVEVLLFALFSRLPALSHEDSLIVRFGGIWDDPNGFSVFCSAFFPLILFSGFSCLKRIVLFFFCASMLVGTQSLTGILAVSFGLGLTCLLCVFFESNRAIYRQVLFTPFAFTIFCFVCILSLSSLRQELTDAWNLFLELKQGSIEGHSESFSVLTNIDILSGLGFYPSGEWGESGYVNLLSNYGLFYTLFYVIFICLSIFYSLVTLRRHRLSQDRVFV